VAGGPLSLIKVPLPGRPAPGICSLPWLGGLPRQVIRVRFGRLYPPLCYIRDRTQIPGVVLRRFGKRPFRPPAPRPDNSSPAAGDGTPWCTVTTARLGSWWKHTGFLTEVSP
jgi:hypothetical protein